MKIKYFMLLILAITTMAFAEIDSTCASYFDQSKMKPKQVPLIKPIKINKMGFGYEHGFLLNKQSQSQGISVHKMFVDYGFDFFVHYNKYEQPVFSTNFPSTVELSASTSRELIRNTEPLKDYDLDFGLKFLKNIVLDANSNFFVSAGSGIKVTKYHTLIRKYILEGDSKTIRFVDSSKDERDSDKTRVFLLLSFGADYIFAENFLVKGELILYGGDQTRFGPNIGLYYWLK